MNNDDILNIGDWIYEDGNGIVEKIHRAPDPLCCHFCIDLQNNYRLIIFFRNKSSI